MNEFALLPERTLFVQRLQLPILPDMRSDSSLEVSCLRERSTGNSEHAYEVLCVLRSTVSMDENSVEIRTLMSRQLKQGRLHIQP